MKKKVYLTILCLTLACVALAITITTMLRVNETQERLREQEAKRDALLAENERLEHDLAMDITDEYIIRIMRKLGYSFPGEEVIVFGDTSTTEEEEG